VLLLDTGPLVYVLNNIPKKLGPKARRAAEKQSSQLAISAASIFEVRILARRRSWKEVERYELTDLLAVCEKQSITVLPVTGEIFNRAADYPLDYRDHFDKLIAATAEIHRLDLVSEDSGIDRLGERWRRIW
jgi:PIN domain nuclease of toxin-antitoxin system